MIGGSGTNITGTCPTTTSGTTGFTSLYSALGTVPTTSTGFYPGVNTAFTNTMQGVDSALGSYFGSPTTTSGVTSLPSGPYTSIYTPSFANYGAGYNSGYGSGYVGFGTTATGVNTNFGTGYKGMVGYNNNILGYTPSVFSGFGMNHTGLGGTGGLGTCAI